jgi:hypothetical protein
MATVYEHPSGIPRFYTFKDGDNHIFHEHPNGRAVYYVASGSDAVYEYPSGKLRFYIANNWLHPYDGTPATLYIGEPLDGEPSPVKPSPVEPSPVNPEDQQP